MLRFSSSASLAAVLLLAASAAAFAEPSFLLDGKGRVFTIDSYGRIAIDGSSTNWYPDREQFDLQVTADGDAVYTDSYDRLCRNGSELGYSWIRKNYFKFDADGSVYTVHDWVSQTIQRNGQDTGYQIEKGSGFVVDREGRLYYTSERTGNLCVDGRDTGRRLDRDDFVVGPDGEIYFVNFHPNHGLRFWLHRYNISSGQFDLVAYLAQRNSWGFDVRGNVWVADQRWHVTKNGQDTGWRSGILQLDGAGNCYTQDSGGQILRNGQATCFAARGLVRVAANGAIVYVQDPANGELYRNGQRLGIRVQ